MITTGAKMKKLGVPGEAELSGKGVSYCAVCDGPFFKDKKVVVVGGGNTACEEALYLCRFASKVILIHRRDRLRAVKGVARKLERNPKIEIIYEEEVAEIKGSSKVEGLKLKSGRDLTAEGVFIFIGYAGSARWIRSFVENKEGFIKTDTLFRTSREGVFAAGDCRSGAFRQVVCACGEGAQAAEEARKYVEKKKGISYDW
ncbi:MAG: NAD(P)/FAD-dependent oxidoreductase [Elusimicrobiota bacterium]